MQVSYPNFIDWKRMQIHALPDIHRDIAKGEFVSL
jgi:hypothetical protein